MSVTQFRSGIEERDSAFALPRCVDSDDFYNDDEGHHFLRLFIQEKVLLIRLPNHDVRAP
jgi:hypothetical protein